MKWPRIVLAFAGFVLIGLNAGASGVLIPSQQTDYGINKVTIGLMFLSFSAGYVLSGLANGTLITRLGVRGHLTLGTGVFVITALVIGLHPPFAALVVVNVVAGLGCGILDAGFNAFASTLPGAQALLNYLHAFFGVGALLGPLIASRMLLWKFPWQDVYLVLAVVGVPILVGCLIFLPSRVPPAPVPANLTRSDAPLARVLRHPSVWIAAVFLCLYVGVEVSVGNWGYTFLTQGRHQGASLAGTVVSGYWLGLTLGRFLINLIASRVGMTLTAMMYYCLAGLLVFTILVWVGPGSLVAASGFWLIGFVLGPIFPTTVVVMPRLVPERLVPTAIGLLVGVSVAGGAVFPYIAGALLQGIGIDSLMPYLLVLGVLQLVGWWLISRRTRPAGQPDSEDAAVPVGGSARDEDQVAANPEITDAAPFGSAP
jgi:fucose permease